MNRNLFPLLLLLTFAVPSLALSQRAPCYADYKAKQDSPLKLHYGVVELQGECASPAAALEIAERLESRGWTLLNVLSVFDASGLEQRKQSAGKFYLRF